MCHIHIENCVTKSVSVARGVSPDCKMCVRVTNTGEIIEDNVYKIYRCPIKWYKCIPTLLQENEITDQQAIEMKVG